MKTTLKFVLLLLVSMLLFGMLYIPHTKAPVTATRVRIKGLQYMLDVIRTNNPADYQTLLTNNPDTTRSRLRLLVKRFYGKDVDSEEALEKMFSDGWKRPLNICYRPLVVSKNPATKLLEQPGDFLIWSSGKDGTNDFGRGDDVLFPK